MAAFSRPFVSLSTDFGLGTRGIGVMEGTVLKICPEANVVNLVHDIPAFDVVQGAKALEGVKYLPVGFHVCVVDPGVGTERKGIAIETVRGDVLIGPDNGVLIPATTFLGGIKRVFVLKNEEFFQKPVSPIFHGRDVFASVAGHLAAGKKLELLGPRIDAGKLVNPAYKDAVIRGGEMHSHVIHVNKFGNVVLNVRSEQMHKMFRQKDIVRMSFGSNALEMPYLKTFGDVARGKPVIVDDDFGRVEVALNLADFAKDYGLEVGAVVRLERAGRAAGKRIQ